MTVINTVKKFSTYMHMTKILSTTFVSEQTKPLSRDLINLIDSLLKPWQDFE